MLQLPLWRRVTCMAGQNAVQRQFESTMDAATGGDVVLIEIKRGSLRAEAEGGEQIAAEEESVFGGVKAAVTVRVSGKRHDAKSAPERDFIAIVKQPVRTKRGLAQHATPDPLGDARDAAPAGVVGAILVMFEIALGPCDPCTVLFRERDCVQNMIEVSVREEDATDGQMFPATGHQSPIQRLHAANEAGVDEIKRLAIAQDEELHDGGADDEQIGRHANAETLKSRF